MPEKSTFKVVFKKLDTILPYPENAKKHDPEQVTKVAESIKRFGFKQPIVIDKEGVIVVGHCRFLAAQLLQIKEVPCLIADDLTPDEIKAYRLADNRLNESAWDMVLVGEELKFLPSDLQAITGFEIKPVLIEGMPDADGKSPFQQMTFTLTAEQAAFVSQAIAKAKDVEDSIDPDDGGNGNGRALAVICQYYVED